VAYALLARWAAGDPQAPFRLDPEALPDSTPFLARLLMFVEREMRGRSFDLRDATGPVPLLDRLRIAYLLWRANLERKRGRFDRAMGLADTVAELRPGHPGAAAFQEECHRAAVEAARRRTEEEPGSPQAHLQYAALLADAERFEEAAAALERARGLLEEQGKAGEFESPETMRLRARVSYSLGRFEQALQETEAGAEPGFTMAETWYYRGLCHLSAGRTGPCLEAFERLVEKVCWAVPLRLREYLAWRRSGWASRSEVRT